MPVDTPLIAGARGKFNWKKISIARRHDKKSSTYSGGINAIESDGEVLTGFNNLKRKSKWI